MSNLGKKTTDDDEVEQLLRAAQDDVLLKLNVNSHMARGSGSAAIDPDLDRRFQALRKPPKRPAKVDDTTKIIPKKTDTVDNKVDGAAAEDDHLFARFAALKTSIPSYNRNEDKSSSSVDQQETEDDSGDEVDKVIKWAIDAARLDPSSASDDDDDDDRDDTDDVDKDDTEDESDDDRVQSAKKGKRK